MAKKMKKEKPAKEITFRQAMLNNLYAIKLLWKMSRNRVIHMAVTTFAGHMAWMFFSTFFIRYIADSIQNETHYAHIFLYIGSVSAVMLIISLHRSYVNHVVKPVDDVNVYKKLYRDIYKKAENVELACYENSKFYDKYTMAVDGAAEKITETTELIFTIISALIAAGITYYFMFRIDKRMILFVIAPILGNFVFGAILNKSRYGMYKENTPYTRRNEYVNRVMYLSDYAKEMRLSGIYNLLKDTYNTATGNIVKTYRKYRLKHIFLSFGQVYFSYTIIFEGIMVFGVYCSVVEKSLTLSEYAILTSMMGLASWALINTANNLLKCNQNGLLLNNLRSFLEYEETIPEDYDGIMPDKDIETIEFRNVSFGYKADTPVISGLSFTMSGKSSIALVGHNGAGKTTIVKLLLRLYDPTEGEILMNGKNIREYNLRAYRELFAAAFQDYKIFAGSVKENILLGNSDIHDDSDEVVRSALARAGVMEKISSLPNEIETLLTKEFDEEGQVFSGGEFQKIVVARAFANPAPIKIFDEPSSALDPIAEYELFESILEESHNNFLMFISHRLSSVKNADEVLMLEKGMIIERGTHAELMSLGGKYADMFTKQAVNYQPDESVVAV